MMRRFLQKLQSDERGLAFIEFAYTLPIFVAFGIAGLEMTNFVLARQKTERLSATMADQIASNQVQPNERQVGDLFDAVEHVASPFSIADNGGNVTITAVIGVYDEDDDEVQNKVAWQRCLRDDVHPSAIGSEWTGTNDIADGPDVDLPNGVELTQNEMVIATEVVHPYEALISAPIASTFLKQGQIFRETTMFRTRGAALRNVTPVSGVERNDCPD